MGQQLVCPTVVLHPASQAEKLRESLSGAFRLWNGGGAMRHMSCCNALVTRGKNSKWRGLGLESTHSYFHFFLLQSPDSRSPPLESLPYCLSQPKSRSRLCTLETWVLVSTKHVLHGI